MLVIGDVCSPAMEGVRGALERLASRGAEVRLAGCGGAVRGGPDSDWFPELVFSA